MDEKIIKTFKNGFDEFLGFKWKISWDLFVVLIVYLILVAVLYIDFQIVTFNKLFANFVLFSLSLLLIEVITPMVYHRVIKKRPLNQLGITEKYWLSSLLMGFILGLISILFFLKLSNVSPINELPLLIISLTVGLSETIFFRGWMQLRLDDAFGAIPSIFIGAVFYALYHICYGVEINQIWVFFILGVIFALIFRLTRNILILWPFFAWTGSFYTMIGKNLIPPNWIIYSYLMIIAVIILFIRFLMLYYEKKDV